MRRKIDVQSKAVPSPIIMAMGAPPTAQLSYSADRKSKIVKNGNWTWTLTPSVTRLENSRNLSARTWRVTQINAPQR